MKSSAYMHVQSADKSRDNIPNSWLISMIVLNSPLIRLENALEAAFLIGVWGGGGGGGGGGNSLQLRYIKKKSLNPFE